MLIASPSFDTAAELFAYIRPLPWARLRVVVTRGKWSAICFQLTGHCEGKA